MSEVGEQERRAMGLAEQLMTLGSEKDWMGSFTRNEAPGAIPNGTQVQKTNTREGEDDHPDGSPATVLGSFGPVPEELKKELEVEDDYFYFVEWWDRPRLACGIGGDRLVVPDPPSGGEVIVKCPVCGRTWSDTEVKGPCEHLDSNQRVQPVLQAVPVFDEQVFTGRPGLWKETTPGRRLQQQRRRTIQPTSTDYLPLRFREE